MPHLPRVPGLAPLTLASDAPHRPAVPVPPMLSTWNDHFPHWGHPIRPPALLAGVLSLGPRDADELAFARAVEARPKVELHVHVEAGVPASFYAELNARQRRFDPDDLPASRAPFETLRAFISAWMDNTRLVEREDDLRRLAREFVLDRSQQNIVYSEAHVSPLDFTYVRTRFVTDCKPLSFADALGAYVAGIRDGERACPGIKVRLIVDALWPALAEERAAVLAALKRLKASGGDTDDAGLPIVVGVGLGGPELSAQAEQVSPFVDACRDLGLKIDIHSGESVSPEEHMHSVAVLRPDRVGHGIAGAPRGFFFPGHIAVCPLSNVLTGSWKAGLGAHPVGTLLERGHPVSVNSDDPLLFGTTLTLEFVALRAALGWGETEVAALTRNACRGALSTEALASTGQLQHLLER